VGVETAGRVNILILGISSRLLTEPLTVLAGNQKKPHHFRVNEVAVELIHHVQSIVIASKGPDHNLSGFNFRLRKLNDNGGDFRRAEMVKAFLVSGEYRDRFDW
jgi:hypothetical protein